MLKQVLLTGAIVLQSAVVTRASSWPDGSAITVPSKLTKISNWEDWGKLPARRWLGSGFWGNRLQDWQIRDGKLIYTSKELKMMKTVHSLSWQTGKALKPFYMKTSVSLPAGAKDGFAGFMFGAGQGRLDWRGASIISGTPGTGGGLLATIDLDGKNALHIRNNNDTGPVHFAKPFSDEKHVKNTSLKTSGRDIALVVNALPQTNGTYSVRLSCWNSNGSKLLGAVEKNGVPSEDLIGNVSLIAYGGKVGTEVAFTDWSVGGERFEYSKLQKFNPIAGTLYSLSNTKLKVGVQLFPLSLHQQPMPKSLTVSIQKKGWLGWSTLSQKNVTTDDYHTLFEIKDWDGSKPAQLRATFKDLDGENYVHPFTVQAEPKPGEQVDIGTFSCMGTNGLYAQMPNIEPKPGDVPIGKWTPCNVWFPYGDAVKSAMNQNADIFFFTGDQIYENRPSLPDSGPNPQEDYLYKFLLWHWAFRDITSNHPTILQTDDHDVYHGDLFGEDKLGNTESDQHGGYHRSGEFVNMVQKTMTAQNPDAIEPTPSKRTGLNNYYTTFDYGDMSFFVLEDRKFKKGAKSTDDSYPETYLGEIQLNHLRNWCETPKPGKRKCVVSQTIYSAMSMSGEGKFPYDWDCNALYVKERNEIVKMIADGGAVILSGDQHLCSFSRLGYTAMGNEKRSIDDKEYSNGPYQFTAPPAGNVFWRWFWPAPGVREVAPDSAEFPSYVGGFRDFFGNPFTMLAVANPEREELQKQMTRLCYTVTKEEAAKGAHLRLACKGDGFGILRFDMKNKKMIAEAWTIQGDRQFYGFPQIVPFGSIDGTGTAANK